MKSAKTLMILPLVGITLVLSQCEEKSSPAASGSPSVEGEVLAGQSAVQDNDSLKDIVKVAAGSPDHTTLVTAVKAAELVDVLSNAGPFTVFAPTNAAFDKLPAGTVETLLKPENKDKLADILQYHVAIGGYPVEMLKDGQTLNMANSGNVKVTVVDGKITLNGNATVVGTVIASNGIVHVVDGVILPPTK
jgi:uncharacterized surface protein with fasciclin (FAS1) repeats